MGKFLSINFWVNAFVTAFITMVMFYVIKKINEKVNIPNELISNSLITELKNVNLNGDITLNEDDNINLTGKLSGTMILKDDITLEPVEYNFSTEIEEILEKNKNILDITDVLWQNILVEIPSKVRSTDEDINLEGNGWRVISDEQFQKERSNAMSESLNVKAAGSWEKFIRRRRIFIIVQNILPGTRYLAHLRHHVQIIRH